MIKTKAYLISKSVVWEAYKRVKANKGSSGVDNESIDTFEVNLKDNLYKLWNRMSSGSYLAPAVKLVEIEKKGGGKRPLGIPTVTDRIAQMVVKITIEPSIDPIFHTDSYGYRPGKSALDAVGMARKRCWRYDWVIDLDIKGFFDNLNHDLLMLALEKHTQDKWVKLYIKRWLKAPMQLRDGSLVKREKGTPQGGVISPLLANLYLHYSMDEWLRIYFPNNSFERYADDSVVHCRSEEEANVILHSLKDRLQHCGLELHPVKTKIVYCKDDDRRGDYHTTKFDFLGYTYCRRRSKNRHGKYFVNFSPAVSNSAMKSMRQKMRGWKVHLRSDKSLEDLSHMFNSTLRGWFNYYGKYYKSALYNVFRHFNRTLSRWAMRKFKKLKGHKRQAEHRLGQIAKDHPYLFYHWQIGLKPTSGQ